MIKHHPNINMLTSYAKGELPASLSIAINIHSQLCSACKQHIDDLTEAQAAHSFEAASSQAHSHKTQAREEVSPILELELSTTLNDDLPDEFQHMFAGIINDNESNEHDGNEAICSPPLHKTKDEVFSIKIKNQSYVLPKVLKNIDQGKWTHLGKINRAALMLGEGDVHTHLLRIDPGGVVPEHTHKGFELTLLLEGEFEDELGTYVKGDFICLDSAHQHSPKTQKGCLCLTVVNDALHFTKGMSKLLNPIGSLIY